MWRCEDEKMWRCEDVKMWGCEDEQMWRWEDVKMSRCEHEQMWRWEDVKMWRCEDVRMWRWADVKMTRCEDEQMWRWGWEDVKMRRCEDEKMWGWEDAKMRICEDEKMWRWEDVLQTPTIGRTLRSDALGKNAASCQLFPHFSTKTAKSGFRFSASTRACWALSCCSSTRRRRCSAFCASRCRRRSRTCVDGRRGELMTCTNGGIKCFREGICTQGHIYVYAYLYSYIILYTIIELIMHLWSVSCCENRLRHVPKIPSITSMDNFKLEKLVRYPWFCQQPTTNPWDPTSTKFGNSPNQGICFTRVKIDKLPEIWSKQTYKTTSPRILYLACIAVDGSYRYFKTYMLLLGSTRFVG